MGLRRMALYDAFISYSHAKDMSASCGPVAFNRHLPELEASVKSAIGANIGALRSGVAALLILVTATTAGAETCDRALYGNLCDTQMRKPTSQRPPPTSMPPIQGIGNDQWVRQDRPATFGAITFQGGKQCIGLLRRSSCN